MAGSTNAIGNLATRIAGRSQTPIRAQAPILALALALVVALGATPAIASAATRYVATDGDDTANDCLDEQAPCLTPQHAIDAATAGDTVELAAGEYVLGAMVAIDKPLTVQGPNAGNDPTGGGERVAEAVITVDQEASPQRTLRIRSNDVTIRGLRFEDNGVAIWHNGQDLVENATIENNVFSGNETDLGSSAAAPGNPNELIGLTFRSNLAEDTAGRSISLYHQVVERQLRIVDNEFVGSLAPVHLGFVDGVEISGNRFTMTANVFEYAILLADDIAGVEIVGNHFDGGDFAKFAIRTWPKTNVLGPVTIAGNHITGLTEFAIDIQQDPDQFPGHTTDATQFAVHANSIAGNGGGVRNGGTGTLDATNNWWGCNAGPSADGSSGCDTIAGDVEADPWLVLAVTASPETIPTGGETSEITATIATNSDGKPAEPPPDGIQVGFETTLGSVAPVSAPLSDGSASATLTSSETAGTADVTASVGSERASTEVRFAGLGPCADDANAICVPPGDFELEATGATIRIEPGAGDVVIRGNENVVVLEPGFIGTVTVIGDGGQVSGTAGDDSVEAHGCGNTIETAAGDDRVVVECVIVGPAARSTAARRRQGEKENRVDGGPGDDRIRNNGSAARLSGGAGSDRLTGGSSADLLRGGQGDDRVRGLGGRDRIGGGSGIDILRGGGSGDRIGGGSGTDVIGGGSGNDRLRGGRGSDVLRGGRGNDRLNGGPGRNLCRPGPGRNVVRRCVGA